MTHSLISFFLCFSMAAACGQFNQPSSLHPIWEPSDSTVLLERRLITQDRRLGEVTDLLPVVTGEDDRRLLVLGSRGILSIRQPDAAASEFEPVQYTAIKRPPEIEGFGNHAFHEVDGRLVVLQSGEPDSTVTLACYSLAGDLLWKVDPDFVRRAGWANKIKSVQILRNIETNSCRILGLTFGVETAVIISAEGQVLSRPRAGPVNSGLFALRHGAGPAQPGQGVSSAAGTMSSASTGTGTFSFLPDCRSRRSTFPRCAPCGRLMMARSSFLCWAFEVRRTRMYTTCSRFTGPRMGASFPAFSPYQRTRSGLEPLLFPCGSVTSSTLHKALS